jgi:sugar phosphate isomerase/epimerase
MALISFCCSSAPWLPLPALLDHAAGYDGVELGVKPARYDAGQPVGFWSNNAALIASDGLEAALPATAAALAARNLRCALLSSYHDAADHAFHRRAAAAARALGCGLVRATVPAPAADARAQLAQLRREWAELARIGAGEGVRFVAELHDHTATPSAGTALRLLDGLDAGAVGVIWDIANTCGEGNEAIPLALSLLGPYLAHVHVKQRSYRVAEQPDRRLSRLAMDIVPLPGEGHVPWRAIGAALAAAGYAGWWSLEDFTRLEQGPARLAADLAWARATLP